MYVLQFIVWALGPQITSKTTNWIIFLDFIYWLPLSAGMNLKRKYKEDTEDKTVTEGRMEGQKEGLYNNKCNYKSKLKKKKTQMKF